MPVQVIWISYAAVQEGSSKLMMIPHLSHHSKKKIFVEEVVERWFV